ncbi:MAG: hypothetical protein DWP97_13010 [Calditrichaeota bacterium]|nr:MAG: hypothetical protein DWP97_13010 [Calditrichota bacterium]
MKKLFYILIAAALLLPLLVQAEEGDGGYAGAFLQVPIGARPTGMGGAYLSISNDGAGMFFNPAGLSSLQNKVFASSYRAMTLDRTLSYTGILLPTQGQSALGFGWLFAGSGSVEGRDTDAELTGTDFSQNNHKFTILFTKRFEKLFSLGFVGSYMHSSFAEMSSYSVSFDLGALFYLSQLFNRERRDMMSIQDIQAGIVLRNLGANYRWNNEEYYSTVTSNSIGSVQEDKIPFEVGIGLSARFFDRKLLLAQDFTKNSKQGIVLHSGAEYFVTEELGIRSGYTDRSFTAGFGYVFALSKYNLAIDYAFSTQKVDEGSEHIFSFDFLF